MEILEHLLNIETTQNQFGHAMIIQSRNKTQ